MGFLYYLEVDVGHGVSDVSAPIACFIFLKRGPPRLGEAHFRTERGGSRR